jgi:hypothetical protein
MGARNTNGHRSKIRNRVPRKVVVVLSALTGGLIGGVLFLGIGFYAALSRGALSSGAVQFFVDVIGFSGLWFGAVSPMIPFYYLRDILGVGLFGRILLGACGTLAAAGFWFGLATAGVFEMFNITSGRHLLVLLNVMWGFNMGLVVGARASRRRLA